MVDQAGTPSDDEQARTHHLTTQGMTQPQGLALMQNLRNDITKYLRRDFITKILGAVLLLVLLTNSFVNRQSLKLIKECTITESTRPGDCRDVANKNTSKAVGNIIDVNQNGVPDHVETQQDLEEIRRKLGLPTTIPPPTSIKR